MDAVAVVIPARDEQDRVLDCLDAVLVARRAAGRLCPRITITLVADDCRDATVRRAASRPDVRVLEIDAACVGTARRVGMASAIAELDGAGEVWLASTDADTIVPPNWLEVQLDAAARGFDAVIGTVRPDFTELPPDLVRGWIATHGGGQAIGHVHGANLGIRAGAYLGAGGFLDQCEHEDNDLVDRLRMGGARMLATDAAEVVTSGRRFGRTSGGFAGYLREQLPRLAPDILEA
ncbi:MAG TPA: glycosyltransferase family 2 protein [Pseudolysinimonas sp.]|nr:glycosyltransferase family 2 protein [Pseudolysinimonas sp.]